VSRRNRISLSGDLSFPMYAWAEYSRDSGNAMDMTTCTCCTTRGIGNFHGTCRDVTVPWTC